MVSGGIAKGRLFHWLPVFPVSSLRSGAYNWQPPWLQLVSVGLLGLADRATRPVDHASYHVNVIKLK